MQYNTKLTAVDSAVNLKGERATFENEKYGSHQRNNFDIWLAKTDVPAPLVIYIHGGGFTGGDKSRYYGSEDLIRFLDAGVSVATINYRFMTEAPFGIKASMNDVKRAVQYIRYNHKMYNIDKKKIACSGGSAGAGTALWLAFSDDMCDPHSSDPVLRESTRILCAGAFAAQSTYDIFKWEKILGLPINNSHEQLSVIAAAFGFHSYEDINLFDQIDIRKELDFLDKMDKSSAPVFVYNKHKGGIPENMDDFNHHPLHAKALKEKAEEVGLEVVVYAPEIGIIDPSGIDLVDFFLGKFFN